WFTDDTPKRFEAYGWHVVPGVDGHNPDAVKKAIMEARSVNDKPSLICCKTVIGFGAPNLCGSHDCHGAALGEKEVAATRENLGWKHEPFVMPDEYYQGFDARAKGAKAETEWNQRFAAYKKAFPELAAELERRLKGELPADWAAKAQEFIAAVNAKAETIASRKASQNTLNGFGPLLPEMIGGSADLAGSNLTIWKGSKGISNTVSDGNYIYYGVREFGMSAIMNGIALHGGFIPYGATFLIFSEYARNALRMAAIMKQRVIFVYTHDSIGLGEDGPTHQPIEQLATLRVIPNMRLWRPCDAVESAVAWKAAIEYTGGPSSLVFSRQNLNHQPRSEEQIANIERGGYVVYEPKEPPLMGVIIATGSEVGLAVDAAKQLYERTINVRVVSMPCTQVFDAQDQAYRESVLPKHLTARVAVEAGVTDCWIKYVGLDGKVIGINTFGESAPAPDLFKHFGFTVENVVSAIEDLL
ncbi:MAG: transketolase, partial [Gammaproteobacteria bacterium]|nr:transketolase [Gammaproteobacteria bacterium]